ncbi:hypothetical protein D3C72_1607600 [compost metagenome]
MAVQGIDACLGARQVEAIGDGVVQVQDAQAHHLAGGQVQGRRRLAVDGGQAAAGAFAGGLAGHAEGREGALLVHMPGLQAEHFLMLEAAGFALLDDQRSDQAAPQLVGAGQVRVVPEAAGIVGLEAVIEIFARQDGQL